MELSEWLALGAELYGSDRMQWEFSCPNCRLILSFDRYKQHSKELKGWQPYAECVGRYFPEVGCNWAAYGLFSGPREITDGGAPRSYSFYFAKEATA